MNIDEIEKRAKALPALGQNDIWRNDSFGHDLRILRSARDANLILAMLRDPSPALVDFLTQGREDVLATVGELRAIKKQIELLVERLGAQAGEHLTAMENLRESCSERIDTLTSHYEEKLAETNISWANDVTRLEGVIVDVRLESKATVETEIAERVSQAEAHLEAIENLKAAHVEAIENLKAAHVEAIENLKAAHIEERALRREEINAILSAQYVEIAALKEAHAAELTAVVDVEARTAEIDAIVDPLRSEIANLREELDVLREQRSGDDDETKEKYEELLSDIRAEHAKALVEYEEKVRLLEESAEASQARETALREEIADNNAMIDRLTAE